MNTLCTLIFSLFCLLLPAISSAESELGQIKSNDDAVIRLNPDDPCLDPWCALRDTTDDPKREPGPFHPRRLMNSGPLTFFQLPVALTPEDLIAGAVDVAILGAPVDIGIGMRGAANGPTSLRANIGGVPNVMKMPHMHTGVAWTQELIAVDYGNAPIDFLSVEKSMPPVRKLVREIAGTGAIPVVIGGDHSLAYPNVAGVTDVYGKDNVGVIHFDAHYDASDTMGGHLISHAQPVRRLIDDGHILGKNYIQVGLRGYWPGEEAFRWMREKGMRYHTMAEIEKDGWDTVIKRVIKEANDGPEYLYVSFDIDVLDPAYTPGTGTPEPNGLTPREVFPLLRHLCAENNLVGFDLVELNPLVDDSYKTTLYANRIIQECLTGIAMRKKGITDGTYLNPLTTDDNRK
jgi:formimidoylglutamase